MKALIFSSVAESSGFRCSGGPYDCVTYMAFAAGTRQEPRSRGGGALAATRLKSAAVWPHAPSVRHLRHASAVNGRHMQSLERLLQLARSSQLQAGATGYHPCVHEPHPPDHQSLLRSHRPRYPRGCWEGRLPRCTGQGLAKPQAASRPWL